MTITISVIISLLQLLMYSNVLCFMYVFKAKYPGVKPYDDILFIRQILSFFFFFFVSTAIDKEK